MIGERELLLAANGHAERLKREAGGINAVLTTMGLDADEVRHLGAALLDQRFPERLSTIPTPQQAYAGGFLDGLIIGVRAARAEQTGVWAQAAQHAREAEAVMRDRVARGGTP
jgi:hypothetical protein